jgi:hypothetical protein
MVAKDRLQGEKPHRVLLKMHVKRESGNILFYKVIARRPRLAVSSTLYSTTPNHRVPPTRVLDDFQSSSMSSLGILRRPIVKHNHFNRPRPCFRRSPISRERLRHFDEGIPGEPGIVDLHHRRYSTTPRRRAHQTRILDDPQSSSSPMTGCFTAISCRVWLWGMFCDTESSSTQSSALCCRMSSSTLAGRVLRRCATKYGVL